MKLHLGLVLCSVTVSFIIIIHAYSNINDYGFLIAHIYDEYHTTGILMGSTINYDSFERLALWHKISKTLSHRGMASLVVSFGEFAERFKFYASRLGRPLNVILFHDLEDIHTFAKLTKNLDMSYGVWLILFTQGTDQDACKFCHAPPGNLLNLKFNSEVLIICCNSNIIEEWWSNGRNKTNQRQLGQWMHKDNEIKWFSNEPLYSRRSSVEGRAFQIAMVEESNFVWQENGIFVGAFGQIFQKLSQSMNFTISKVIKDTHGLLDPDTSNWTGAIGRLERGEADIGLGDFSLMSQRRSVVDFTIPIVTVDFRLYIKKPDVTNDQWNAYLKAFSMDTWLVIIAFISTMPLFLTLIKYNRRRFFFLPLVFEHYLHVWGIYCRVSLSEFSNETSSKILCISLSISALVISGAYSASLTSFMTVSQLPFNNMEQFVKDGSYGLIVLQHGADYDMFRLSNESVMQQMMSVMEPNELLPKNHLEGFQQVCLKRVAFHTDYQMSMESAGKIKPCEMVSIVTGTTEISGIIMPLRSEYTALINYHLNRFRRSGMLQRTAEEYLMQEDPPEKVHLPVPLRGIVPILGIVVGGFIIASIILLIERILHCFMNE